jgi:hypothetical protein
MTGRKIPPTTSFSDDEIRGILRVLFQIGGAAEDLQRIIGAVVDRANAEFEAAMKTIREQGGSI